MNTPTHPHTPTHTWTADHRIPSVANCWWRYQQHMGIARKAMSTTAKVKLCWWKLWHTDIGCVQLADKLNNLY